MFESANRLRDVAGRAESTASASGLAQITSASLDHMLCTGEEVSLVSELVKAQFTDQHPVRNTFKLYA